MKKKIINGILMAAMLFAGTTSFVSCKDNVDDVATQIYKDLDAVKANLQGQIDALSARLTTLEGTVATHTQQIKDLQDEVAEIEDAIDALNNRVTNLEAKQKKLQARMDAAEEAIKELENYVKNMITGVIVQETKDAVVGTINGTFIDAHTLVSYYGMNKTGIKEFPTTSALRHAYGDAGQLLSAEQIAGAKKVTFEGRDALITQYKGNVGKIYFTLNPTKIDPTGVAIDIINSKGEVYPFELTDIQKSSHLLTVAIGKHGNGINDEEVADENSYLYEATVSLPIENMDKAIAFNLEDTWKNTNTIAEVKQMIANAKAANTAGGKTAAAKSVAKDALQILQNNYQTLYNIKSQLTKQALRATWAGGDNDVISAFDITTAAVEPLSYGLFWELDVNTKATINRFIDINDLEKVIAAIGKAILNRMPNIDFTKNKVQKIAVADPTNGAAEINVVLTDGSGNAVTLAGLTGYTGINADVNLYNDIIKKLTDELNTKMVDYVNDYLTKIQNKYNTLTGKNLDQATIVTKLDNWLDRFSNKLTTVLGEHYFFRAVSPILLFEGSEGIDRLSPGMTISCPDNILNVIMTSPTEEYLVPAMYKYVAVRQGGKIVYSATVKGTDKILSLELPKSQGDVEIIYQTIDYSGYVVSKTYPITIE